MGSTDNMQDTHRVLAQVNQRQELCLKFGNTMVWNEPKNHITDCYFCAIDLTRINKKNQSNLPYPCLKSAPPPILSSIAIKFQYLNVKIFLKSKTEIPLLLKKMKMCFWKPMVHVLFYNRRQII